ncbi:MAG: hypothetical protein AABY22_21820 [Nanoarchaeota archaeon]
MSTKASAKGGGAFQPLRKGLEKAAANLKEQKVKDVRTGLNLPEFRKVERTDDINEKETAIRNWISGLPKEMDELTKQLMSCLDGDEVHFDTHAKEFEEVEKIIADLLNPGIASAREAAINEYALALATNVPAKKWLINAVINGRLRQDKSALPCLVGIGMAAKVEKGPDQKDPSDTQIFLNGDLYEMLGKYARRIVGILRQKISVAKEDAHDYYIERSNKLLNQTDKDYGFEALNAKKPCEKFGFNVPERKVGAATFAGGTLLVQSDGQNIRILDAVGRFSRRMLEIRDRNVHLQVRSLSWERFTGHGLNETLFNDLRIFWDVITRSMMKAEEVDKRLQEKEKFRNQCDEERNTLAKKATVGANEWLFEKVVGVALIYLPPFWEVTHGKVEKKFFYPCFLVERNTENKVKLAEFPERLKDLFPNPKLSEFTDPGDTNQNLAYPLGSMLRTAYGVTVRTQKRNASTSAPAEKSE